ncbi:hypothetical protein [Kitasatospora sp. NPDC088351]|uniref:DUF6895 family protein n=1 Tax=Kitasatospora sp. NPDC088351 TaxID=3155180 RepID=UPI00341CF0C2
MAGPRDRLTAPPGAAPRAEYLHHRIDEVLEFAAGQLRHLDDYAAHWHDDPGEMVRKEDKVAIETAMLLLVTGRIPGHRDGEAWRRLVDECVRRCRGGRVRCVIARHPRTVSSLGLGHLFLSALGCPDEDLDHLLENAVGTGQVGIEEHVPFRRLEFEWARRGAAHPAFAESGRAASKWRPEVSAIASDRDGLYATREDCYALTHTLMYATDFGAAGIPGIDTERLRSSIGSTICFALAIDDFDLLGELLLADAVLPGHASAAARCGWAVRTRVLDDRGALPGPTFRDAELAKQEPAGRAGYRFYHSYHTTYVDALLCAAVLSRRHHWFAPEPADGPRADEPQADDRRIRRIAGLAWPGGPRSGAAAALLDLCTRSIVPGARLGPLAETAIIEVVRRYDLVALRRILQEVRGSSIAESRSIAVATRFLANQTALATCLESPVTPRSKP